MNYIDILPDYLYNWTNRSTDASSDRFLLVRLNMEPLLNTTTRSSCALDYDFKSTTLFWFVVTFSRRLKIKLISRSDVMEEKIYSMPVAGGERFVCSSS